MNFSRKLPIGVQSFEKLRNDTYVYVDKSRYIWELVQQVSPYFLSRPRRFGKSLFLSSLKAYFLGQKELFTDLALEALEEAQADKRGIWQKYPVLYLDFNGKNYADKQALYDILNAHLKDWETSFAIQKQDESPDGRFMYLLKAIYEKTGKQAVVLVDEYDKPLLETMYDNPELNEEYRKILKGFYGVLKSSDLYLRFAFLTGVTKFSKVSIFSDLNNLRDISLEKDYAGICGITEAELKQYFQPEIAALAAERKISYEQTLAVLKKQYDGYRFHPEGAGLYNPFSLLNAFAKRDTGLYWFSTGTPTFLVQFLQKQTGNVREILEEAEMTESALQDYRPDMQNPIPILFQAGCLTIKNFDERFRLYKLGFPNDEVKYDFLDNLVPVFTSISKNGSGLFIGNFLRDLETGNITAFMERMYTACAGLPYSLAAKENSKMRERDYQIAFYILFTLMGQFAQTEVRFSRSTAKEGSGSQQERCFGNAKTRHQNYTRTYSFGVADCVVHTPDAVYVFEFKLMGTGTTQEALQQIKEKGYAEPYRMSGKKVVIIGAVFNDGIDEDTPDTWLSEELPPGK